MFKLKYNFKMLAFLAFINYFNDRKNNGKLIHLSFLFFSPLNPTFSGKKNDWEIITFSFRYLLNIVIVKFKIYKCVGYKPNVKQVQFVFSFVYFMHNL